ncbi:unnamed protein product, partial [Ixodes persulcatus]
MELLARVYVGITWQTIKDCRAKKLYRGVRCQEQARLRSVTPVTPRPATPLSSTQPSSSPIQVQLQPHVPTSKAQINSRVPRLSNTKQRAQKGQEVQSPTCTSTARKTQPGTRTPLTTPVDKPVNRPWTADDTRALALLGLQAPAAMVCDEELDALLPKRTWESVREHRR